MFSKNNEKERLRLAVLNQERTFREQVNELHRLYRLQKILMREMKQEADYHRTRETVNWTDRPRVIDLERPAEEYEEDDGMPESEEETEIELTLATGTRSRKKNTSSTSESRASFSSLSSESRRDDSLKFHDWVSLQPPRLHRCLSLSIS
ncbi:glycosyltransferase-like protein [Wolffia australiana]